MVKICKIHFYTKHGGLEQSKPPCFTFLFFDLFRACGAEAACAAVGFTQGFHLFDGHHGNGQNDHLCHALARFNGIGFADLVNHTDLDFAAVVAVNHTDGIQKPNAVLNGKPAARSQGGAKRVPRRTSK